ncbi:family 43 glycosylhydrolase [Sediminibacillus terrae]|uniref:family 43 glycosylhydrolase n=1 Tax=Sediminibacillus terrae TaxID=1562106 RepID=UPI001295CD1C|nr:family 43 glycosylhydrolase [Sediminibacillus terrae]
MRLLSVVLFVMIGFCSACSGDGESPEKPKASGYQNPIMLDNEWEDYGLGDPYVFKYNGLYYLYVSTRDTDIGVKVWSSPDLVDWKYEGLATEEEETRAAYAPEVIYWNGYFYMYTSPGGNGHYVLKSDSPVGPFEVVTDNFGKSIDGNVFIDDDGSMYFSHAGTGGIEIASMRDPETVGESTVTAAYMNGWTEGSTIFKRNGKYYMTYTGNHVFSEGYRIDYAVSDSPTNGYRPSRQNPLVLNTEGETVGLGHNSVVKGPNLDTDYIFYHNLEGPGVVGPLRHMNMDRMAWNGDKMSVLGPTHTKQQSPELPAFEDRFGRKNVKSNWINLDDGDWEIDDKTYLRQTSTESTNSYRLVTKAETKSNYTAEFHAKLLEDEEVSGLYGAVFSYQDENNYGVALLDPSESTLVTRFVRDGKEFHSESSILPTEFDFTKLHQIRVEKSMHSFKVYVDGMLKQTVEASLKEGKIGYLTKSAQAEFGYVAFSNKVNGSGVWDINKPLPGTVEAVHYQSGGEGIGYHDDDQGSTNNEYRPDPVDIRKDSEGAYYVRMDQPEEWLSYKVNVDEANSFHADLRIATQDEDSQLKIKQGDTDITGTISLPNTGGNDNWRTITIKDLELTKGNQELRIEVVKGEVNIASMTFYKGSTMTPLSDDFTERINLDWSMYENYWSVKDDTFQPSDKAFSKVLVGENGWTDYQVEADIQLGNTSGDAGILVRGLNPANGMSHGQNNPDFMQGYYAFITTNGIYLGKQNYGWETLDSVSATLPVDSWHHVKADVKGTRLKVFVNDMDTPKIVYEDTSVQPFTHGKAGFRVMNNQASFDNFQLKPN